MPNETEKRQRIVVGVDGSEVARGALRWALAEARLRGAVVQIVHAWHNPYVAMTGFPVSENAIESVEEGARRVLDDVAASAASEAQGVTIEPSLVSGPPATSLLDAAQGADLLVVGSRGHGGFTGLLLGSVSQQVVHHAPCPVVIVPPSEPED